MLFLDKEIALGPTDRYIYDCVCKNLDRVVYMRVRELAEACNVSPSTIMRFCVRFGCDGNGAPTHGRFERRNVYVGPDRTFASEQTVAQMRLLEEATSKLG